MRIALIGVALLVMVWAEADPFLRMPPNSYLVRPVNSARELAQQIRTEPVVAQRYARHFRQPAYAIADFFEKNLRLTKLARSEEFFVYYAPSDGQLLVKRRLLPRGKEVFVLKSSNTPVLLKECGNPLTAAMHIPVPTMQASATPVMVATPAPVIAEMTPQAVLPGVEIVEVPLEEAVAADLFPPAILSELETLPEAAPELPPAVAPVAVAPQVPTAPVAHAANWWAMLPMLGLLFIPKGGGPPEVIPEPATWMMLTAGLGMLYWYSGRAFRRVRNSSQRGESSR